MPSLHRARLVLILAIVSFPLACASAEENARSLYNQSLAELRAGNDELAKELLDQIVSDYPATEVATDANQKLDELRLAAELSRISSIGANHQSAISTIRNIITSQITYSATMGEGYYALDLSILAKAGLFAEDLASTGEQYGYRFTMQGEGMQFTVNADPIISGETGERHFFGNESGVIRWSTEGPANAESSSL